MSDYLSDEAKAILHKRAMIGRIRLVPKHPDPKDFPYVPFACDERPARCPKCERTGTYFCLEKIYGKAK